MEGLIAQYLAAPELPLELEVKFGTKGPRIGRDAYDRVASRLLSIGFRKLPQVDLLRVIPVGGDVQNIRYEAEGKGAVRAYCVSEKPSSTEGQMIEKKRVADPVEIPEFGFRVVLASEDKVDEAVLPTVEGAWTGSKKLYRLGKRISMVHDKFPLRVDLTVVKSNAAKGLVPTARFADSRVTKAMPTFEVEIEVQRPASSAEMSAKTLHRALRTVTTYVLQGLQGTNYPVSMSQQEEARKVYRSLTGIKADAPLRPKNFIGPSSVTLQMRNIAPINPNAQIPNVREGYAVTDKADGERKLMLIDGAGAVYLIDTNMRIQFTGTRAAESASYNSILDGEHILRDKQGAWINLYAAFDCYILNKKDVRGQPFAGEGGRLELLRQLVKRSKFEKMDGSTPSPLRVVSKSFYTGDTIFAAAAALQTQLDNGAVGYETDGIILTPTELAVGATRKGGKHSTSKVTWEHSFKWKPPEQNTIDFLVRFKDDKRAKTKFQSGLNMRKQAQLTKYQAVELRVGYDEERHGVLDPCRAVRDGTSGPTRSGYKPVVFVPSNPFDPNAGKCNLLLGGPSNLPRTEAGAVIENNSIVEMAYDPGREAGWRWKPLRVRFDKTAELRSGGRNFGNAYHVANSNWHSLHNPVTLEMLVGREPIPDELADSDIYYNSKGAGQATKAMRNFHNLYVKQLVVGAIAQEGDSLVDLAVGKGGDLPKWINAKLGFVFGMDISRDNIENGVDGACARYLNYKSKFDKVPVCLFAQGDAGKNVVDGVAFAKQEGAKTLRTLMGLESGDDPALGRICIANRGIAKDGFGACSIQFALHYLCSDIGTLAACLRNISEVTRVGGKFAFTAFDGAAVFKMLRSMSKGETLQLSKTKGEKMWSITKEYSASEFPPNVSSLGLAVDVFQDSINQSIREYLVNFDYVTLLLESFGFVPISKEEATRAGLPASADGFRALFRQMNEKSESKDRYGMARRMSDEEKQVSFLNRYAIFKKARDIDAKAAEARLVEGLESQNKT